MSNYRNITSIVTIGLIGIGLCWLFALMSSPEWGPPGTAAYLAYEARNRLIPLPLFLMALGFIVIYVGYRGIVGRLGAVAFAIILFGLALMVIGNVAEFWFFTTLSYGTSNGRAWAWSTFLLGVLFFIIGTPIFIFALVRGQNRL